MGRTLTGARAGAPPRILVADSFAPEGLEVLRARAGVDVQRGLDEAGLVRTLAAGCYDALIVRSESRVTSVVLGASPRLRVVARAGVGVDNIDVEAATRHGVLVLNMPTGNTITTAEHTIALLCALVRHVPQANAALPAGAYVINCARGGRVDEEALLAALESGHIAGAALDVFVDEPVRDPHHPLISHPRVVATPHLGAATREAQLKVALGTAHEVLAALAGEPVQTAVNAPVAPQGMAETLKPYVALAHTLGQLAVQWDRGPLTGLRVGVSGDLADLETEPLVASALTGIFSTVTAERVNLVNARLVAEERGVQIEEVRSSAVPEESYRGALHVRLQRDRAHWVDLAGTVVHGQAHLLSINAYRLDLPLTCGEWLVTRHHD